MHRLRTLLEVLAAVRLHRVAGACVRRQRKPTLAPELRANIDELVHKVLATTGVPSASLAVVKDGKIAYLQAYGDARLDPHTPASPEMRYSIGSISKQFTAAAILMLAEEGKLSLDDPVSKYVSGLTRGNEVTIRELLSHTSGYQDYWPQDYVMPMMLKPVTPDEILDRWAPHPAGLRSRHEVAVQQHQLRDRRRHRGESQRDAAVDAPGQTSVHASGNEEHHRHE